MNRFEDSSLDEQIRRYTQQLLTSYQSAPTTPAPVPTPNEPQPVAEQQPVAAEPTEPAAPPPPLAQPSDSTPEADYRRYLDANSQRGILRVQTLTARSTFPVPNVKVIVSKVFDSGEYIIATQETDNAGKTEGLLLPAPDRALSEQPSDNKKPFADYKVTVIHPDFATMVVLQLPVFAGESSLQLLNLIPATAAPHGEKTIQYITTEPSDL